MKAKKSAVNLDAVKGGVQGKPPRKAGKSTPYPQPKQVDWRRPPYVVYGDPADAQMLSDPSLSMFFLEKDLRAGTKISLDLVKKSNGVQIYFLPRHLSDKIPFSSEKLSMALDILNLTEGSEWARTMKESVQQCERPAIRDMEEGKYCATSLESMIDYSTSELGTSRVNVLATNVPKNSVKQQYAFTGIPFKSTSKSVVCHSVAYAYAVYYCHKPKATMTVQVSLQGGDGTRADGIVLCHDDTSSWNTNHVAFQLLNVRPGGAAVCHFIAEDHVVWLAAN